MHVLGQHRSKVLRQTLGWKRWLGRTYRGQGETRHRRRWNASGKGRQGPGWEIERSPGQQGARGRDWEQDERKRRESIMGGAIVLGMVPQV